MTIPEQSTVRNHLLRTIAPDDFTRLQPHLEPVRFERGAGLFEVGDVLDHAIFLDTGIGSLVAISPEGHRVEGGIFGRDGFAPVGLVMSSSISPYEGFVQVAGSGWRMPAAPLVAAVEERAALRDILLRYAYSLSIQSTYTALSNSVHPVDERLARWLLMCHDRIDGSEIELTHEFLSLMLAVRRPSVTTALHVLEGNRFIRTERGCIVIINRQGLEEFAGDAYGRPEAEYRRMLGHFA